MKKIMSILIISMFFLTLLSTISVAQIINKENDKITTLGNGEITCKVIDGKANFISYEGATVKLYKETKSSLVFIQSGETGKNGLFSFNGLSSDYTYTIKATYDKRHTEGEVNNIKVNGEIVEIKIALNGRPIKNSIFPRVFQNNYLSLLKILFSKI